MATLTITATVPDADIDAFIAADPEVRECFAARLTEVYGDNAALLHTITVDAVHVHDEADDEVCDHDRIACLNCRTVVD